MCSIFTDLPVSEMSAPRSEVHNVSRTRDDSQGRLIERLFTFNCDDCGRTYGSSTKLSRHRRDKHGPQLSCYHCGKEFAQSRRWALEIHVKTCKAKFWYRTNDERGYEVNRGQHANRRQECHPYKSVPQSSANSYRPVSQPSVNRTKPSDTVTLATLNTPLSRDNESDKLTVEVVDLSTNTQSVRSPEIETFSFYDQNVMNGFTNLSVPEAQLQLATCKTIHVPLSNTNDLSDLINFDLPLTLDNTNESKDPQEDRQPSDSKIEVSHPTPTSVSLANHNTGTTATTTYTSSMSQEVFQIPTIGGTQQQQQQMMAPPPTITIEQQQQQMMAPSPTITIEQQQQQMMTPPPTITIEQQQQQMMAPPPTITVEQQQQQQQMMAPPPTTTVEQRQQQMMITPPPPITKEQQQQQMMAPPQTSVQSKLMNPAKTTMQQPIEIPRRDYPIYSAPRATEVMCTVTKQMKVQCTNAISVGTTPSE